jgi:carbamoyltransferase
VCLARGKMEFGPRALGNRSIIALPTKENKEKINKRLKRNWFMPFAPTILYEFVDDYLINPRYSPFMTQIFRVREDKIKEIEGVIHVDKTTRPQTLKREANKTYYEIIKYIYDSINLPVVLNTSFNLHGEPIVCTERDAINSFLKADFDALLLGNYLISK